MATFGDFSSFPSAGALASYVGAVPALKQSGKRTFQREPHADRRGPLAGQAVDARDHRGPDESLAASLLRTAQCSGQVAKVALVAAMRKLLHAVYSVATHRRPFVANLVTTEARS